VFLFVWKPLTQFDRSQIFVVSRILKANLLNYGVNFWYKLLGEKVSYLRYDMIWCIKKGWYLRTGFSDLSRISYQLSTYFLPLNKYIKYSWKIWIDLFKNTHCTQKLLSYWEKTYKPWLEIQQQGSCISVLYICVLVITWVRIVKLKQLSLQWFPNMENTMTEKHIFFEQIYFPEQYIPHQHWVQ
jgi:hypothetical protein